MPNDVIDLGYHGVPWFCASKPSDNDGFDWFSSPAPSMDAYVRDQHNRIKFQLEAENGGLNWSVGRIFRWANGLAQAYGWVITHLDGTGSATGREWLMTLSGQSTSTGIARTTSSTMWEGTGSPLEYMSTHHHMVGKDTEQADTASAFYGLHYHTGGLLGALFTYDVGAGADFDAPATNPRSDKAGFMPDTPGNPYAKGAAMTQYPSAVTGQTRTLMLFNHEKPFLAIYDALDRNHFLRRALILGDVIIPRLSTDPYVQGTVVLVRANGKDAWPSVVKQNWAYVVDEQGIPKECAGEGGSTSAGDIGVVYHRNFTHENQPRPDGTWDRDRVKVMPRAGLSKPVTGDKGYIDPDIVANMGVYMGHLNRIYDSPIGKSIKMGPALVIPWVDGYPVPFAGWPLNPQRKYEP